MMKVMKNVSSLCNSTIYLPGSHVNDLASSQILQRLCSPALEVAVPPAWRNRTDGLVCNTDCINRLWFNKENSHRKFIGVNDAADPGKQQGCLVQRGCFDLQFLFLTRHMLSTRKFREHVAAIQGEPGERLQQLRSRSALVNLQQLQ